MSTSYYADRINLFFLQQQHPHWSQQAYADALHRSKSWVGKWQHRLHKVPKADLLALHTVALGQSRARKQPPERIDPQIEAEILAIRDDPPEGLRRTPGPKAILYYLPRRLTVWQSQLRLPTSTRTVSAILKRNQRIASHPTRPQPSDEPRPTPLSCWQMDLKDVSTVADDPVDPTGKRQHVAEAFNIVDEGTSLLLWSEVRVDFTAETVLASLAEAIERYGVPGRITLDRDPRSVGAPQGSDFPSALLRFGRCLGIEMQVCPPAPNVIPRRMDSWSGIIAPISRNVSTWIGLPRWSRPAVRPKRSVSTTTGSVPTRRVPVRTALHWSPFPISHRCPDHLSRSTWIAGYNRLRACISNAKWTLMDTCTWTYADTTWMCTGPGNE
jgi:hypothetical protein